MDMDKYNENNETVYYCEECGNIVDDIDYFEMDDLRFCSGPCLEKYEEEMGKKSK